MTRFARTLAIGALVCLAMTGCGGAEKPRPARATPGPEFVPTEENRDPTRKIEGVLEINYVAGKHVIFPERVAYDHAPPLGGAHDHIWAACNGVVYPTAVRTEHLVHSLEHGAVWVSYDPRRVRGDDRLALAERVEGRPYTFMSPFPGQPKPVSVQSWGRQLQVDSIDDPRIDQFIVATRTNPYLNPEPGAPCDAPDAKLFDQDDPPPFDPAPPGPDAVPVTGRP
ncbi:DUF3105 domain-containing protein [Actinokineospora sp.]|uniref:DUF3105 domain-containing protein n=1 Tax=Actinokineospora sp. TaxID=1872133 RepID=UPI0040383AEB